MKELKKIINPSLEQRLQAQARLLAPVYDGEVPVMIRSSAILHIWRLEDRDGNGPWHHPQNSEDPDFRQALEVSDALGAPHHCGLPMSKGDRSLITGVSSFELLEAWFAPVWERLRQQGFLVTEYMAFEPYAFEGPLQCTFLKKESRFMSSMPMWGLQGHPTFTEEMLREAGIRTDIYVKLAYGDALTRYSSRVAYQEGRISKEVLDHLLSGARGAQVAGKYITH